MALFNYSNTFCITTCTSMLFKDSLCHAVHAIPPNLGTCLAYQALAKSAAPSSPGDNLIKHFSSLLTTKSNKLESFVTFV